MRGMFIFRLIRRVFTLIGIITVIWMGIQYSKTNSPIHKKIEDLKASSMWKEGVKDFKAMAGEVFTGVGKKINEDVTESDKKKLDDILMKEVTSRVGETKKPEVVTKTREVNVQNVKTQEAKAPATKTVAPQTQSSSQSRSSGNEIQKTIANIQQSSAKKQEASASTPEKSTK